MKITRQMLIDEIKVLQKASALHASYSIEQYKKVLKALEELEREKEELEEKIRQRTRHLEMEIRQKAHLADRLEKVAKYDSLTGLANRYLFLNELKLVLEEADLLGHGFALLFIDLDDFKYVNDTYGHEVGDELLRVVAKRMQTLVRSNDMIARLGGDEFTVILKNVSQREMAGQIAKKIIEAIMRPVEAAGLRLYVGASVGIYLYNGKDSYQDIVSKADIAMYEAKKAGKGRYVYFDEGMQAELKNLTRMRSRIRRALQNGELRNWYQPIVSSLDYRIRGAEVLLRWYDKDNIVSPADFMPVLEEDVSLMKRVTFWQIEEAVTRLEGHRAFFSINLSAKLINDEDLLEYLRRLRQRYGFLAERIAFEVTETTLSTNLTYASQMLKKIKQMGFHLSLDDFGTGYSSLAYLRELPFDTLKIDKRFIDNLQNSAKDRKILMSVIQMAQALEMKTVLEGIESARQLKVVPRGARIKYQGYLFYRPMPFEKLKPLLTS